MRERILRGWSLARQSWRLLTEYPTLAVFPLLATVFGFFAIAAIAVPTAIGTGLFTDNPADDNDPVFYLAFAAAIYVCTLIVVFFNVALAESVARLLRGERVTIAEGVGVALRRLGPILSWALISATIGLVLRAVGDRSAGAGKVAVVVADAAWAIATFFVIPLIALEGSGPWRALNRSVVIAKDRWGESATGTVTISAVTTLLVLVATGIGYGGFYLLSEAGRDWPALGVLAVAMLAVIAVGVISSALTGIFRVAVYQYATTGETPAGFDEQLLASAMVEGHK